MEPIRLEGLQEEFLPFFEESAPIPISPVFSLFSRLCHDLLVGFILSLSSTRLGRRKHHHSPALSLLPTMPSSSSSTAGESQTSPLSLSSIDNLLHFPSFFPIADLPGFLFLLRHRTSRTTHHGFFFLQTSPWPNATSTAGLFPFLPSLSSTDVLPLPPLLLTFAVDFYSQRRRPTPSFLSAYPSRHQIQSSLFLRVLILVSNRVTLVTTV